MQTNKATILADLKAQIRMLEGYRPVRDLTLKEDGRQPTVNFLGSYLSEGAVHEFICPFPENAAATAGFAAIMLAALLQKGGAVIWISASRWVYPPALKAFGLEPEKIIFIDVGKEREVLWAMEESLRCKGVTAVVGELQELSFNASRRLQLSVELSRATGFLLRNAPRKLNTSACVTRWKISAQPGEVIDGLPGVGFPQWNVELLKIRNGRPQRWQVKWVNRSLVDVPSFAPMEQQVHKKTG